jgi:hypothetical protein
MGWCIRTMLPLFIGILAMPVTARASNAGPGAPGPEEEYCTPGGTPDHSWITGFATTGCIADVSNLHSGREPGGYSDFTGLVVQQTAGDPVNFSIAVFLGDEFTLWVDWNQDNEFAADEQADVVGTWENPSLTSIFSGNFLVPLTALEGLTRMRIAHFSGVPQPNESPCITNNHGEFEDYGFEVVLPSCFQPSGVTVVEESLHGGSFAWLPSLSAMASYHWEVRDELDSALVAGTVEDTLVVVTDLPSEADFVFRVRADCDANGTSTWVEVPFHTGYCVPSSSGSSSYTYINDFHTSGGSTNINNANSGFSTGGYGSFIGMKVTQMVNHTVSFSATKVGSFSHFAIYVDWDQDLVFETEEVAYEAGDQQSYQGSITVPMTALEGTTRMRVCSGHYNAASLCGHNQNSSIEFEDYSFEVVHPSCFQPIALETANHSFGQMDLGWGPFATPPMAYQWKVFAPDLSVAASGITTGTQAVANGLVGNTTYTLKVRALCTIQDRSAWAGPLAFTTVSGCGDAFTDEGGADGNYADNDSLVKTYCSSVPGEQVHVAFTSFHTEPGYDKLFVFNGVNTEAPKLASGNDQGTGNTTYGTGGWWGDLNGHLPGPFTSNNANGCLTFAFVSDDGGNQAGWNANASCVASNQHCLNSLPILCGNSYQGSTVGRPLEVLPACDPNFPSPTGRNWWRFEGTGDAVTFSTCDNYSNFVHEVRVYTGEGCTNIACVPVLSASSCIPGETRTIQSQAGETYWVVVSATDDADGGNYVLDVSCTQSCPTSPVIHASTSETCYGGNATLSANNLAHPDEATWQWESSTDSVTWLPVPGANGGSLSTPPQILPTWYRLAQTCTSSGTATYSNAVHIGLMTPVYAVYDGVAFYEDFENWQGQCGDKDSPGPYWRNSPFQGNNSWRRNDQGGTAFWEYTYPQMTGPTEDHSAVFHSTGTDEQGYLDLFIDMSAATGGTWLTFNHWTILASSGSLADLRVMISTDGGLVFQELSHPPIMDLAPIDHAVLFHSNSPTTVIRLEATGNIGLTYMDLWVDDLVLSADPGEICGLTYNTDGQPCLSVPTYGYVDMQYEFHVTNGAGMDVTVPSDTSLLPLGQFLPPVPGVPYQVEYRGKWVNSSSWPPFATFCGFQAGAVAAAAEGATYRSLAESAAELWPNPVSGHELNLHLSGLEDREQHLVVSFLDLYGKQVHAMDLHVHGPDLRTTLPLPDQLANGVYLVRIDREGRSTLHRLSVVR